MSCLKCNYYSLKYEDFESEVLFDSGYAALHQQVQPTMRALAVVLKQFPHAVQVEGYTDNVPIQNETFPSFLSFFIIPILFISFFNHTPQSPNTPHPNPQHPTPNPQPPTPKSINQSVW